MKCSASRIGFGNIIILPRPSRTGQKKTTEAVFALSVAADLDPSEIVLPLSEEGIFKPLCGIHDFVRTPVEDRPDTELCRDFYPGVALSEDELRWVAIHIQNSLIPAV